ncbi:MAG: hypothetical protein NXH88_14935, partial [Hyphomonas sp.]|nr:hypothetical protein [Hyphomonas sp.]
RLAHETLIVHWQRLNDLVGTLRSDLQVRDWLDPQARHWADGDKDDADLIRNTQRLAAARQAIEQGVVPIKPSTQDFVTASEEHLQQQRDAQSARGQRDRRNRLLAGVAAALTVSAGFGAWALFERNQADNQANLAQLAIERAGTEAALAAEQAARAEDAERAAEQARALQEHAEVASADLLRMLNLRDVQDATALATEGRKDLALLWLHHSFERLLDADFLGSNEFRKEREESIITLDSILRRAAAESRYEIPGDAVGFGLRNMLYYQVPSQNTLWRAQLAGPPINIGSLSGRVLEVYDLLAPLGAVLATRNDNQLVFRRFDPSERPGEILLTVPSQQTNPEWDISMGPDGVALIRERAPEEALRNDPDVVPPVFLARLDEGKTERLSDDGRYWLNAGEGGVSFLEASLEEDAEAAESLGVRSVLNRDHIGLGGDYTQCLGADAARDQAPLYERAIRSVADFANRIRCDAEGDYLAISAETNTSRGPVDRLHLVDVRALAEGEQRQTEIAKPYNFAWGISLFALPEQHSAELVHYNAGTVSLTKYVGEPSRTLTLPRTIETAVALGQERAAIIMSQGVGTQDTKLLSIVDFKAADDFGKTMLPRKTEPLEAASAVGQMYGLRDYDDPQRQNCVDFSEQADWTASDASMVTVSSPAGDADVPRAWLQQSNCIKISPSGEFAALWADGALNVLETQNSTTIATYEIDRKPRDFVFSECCGAGLLITEANAVVHKPIPSFSTTLDVDGAVIARGYPRDTEPAYPLLLADGPIVSIDVSPEESRLLYTVATGTGTLETRLHSMEPNLTWKTLGVSSNFLDSYFIDEDTISYWNPSRSYIYEIPQLSEAKSLIAGALSVHCRLRGDRAETSDCLN